MGSKKDIVIFSLGPVQSFISTARRTHDLFSSSRLLSDLVKAALDDTVGKNNVESMYPVKSGASWPTSLPNRAVLATPVGQGNAVGEAMTNAVNNRWLTIITRIKKEFQKLAPSPLNWPEIWDKQVADFLEIYWISYEWDDSVEDYSEAIKAASHKMNLRKQVRHFPIYEEHDVKCTMCGVRQALRGAAPEFGSRNFGNRVKRGQNSIYFGMVKDCVRLES